MKTLLLLTILLTPHFTKSTSVQFPQNGNDTRAEILKHCPKKASLFINSIWDDAKFVNENYNIPMALCIAQAIQESGFGTSKQAVYNCNYFGIMRCKKYVSYNCKRECFNDYANVLKLPCYGEPKTLQDWFDALECCNYAGDLKYTKRLKKIIETYKLYLL